VPEYLLSPQKLWESDQFEQFNFLRSPPVRFTKLLTKTSTFESFSNHPKELERFENTMFYLNVTPLILVHVNIKVTFSTAS
jgi:hypothetical protein